jgi:Fe-S oxidoreductase
VFRDELGQLFPDDARAARLARGAVSLAELLQARGWQPPASHGTALVHGHCHQKALAGMQADLAVLRAAACEAGAPDTGCCGMAGAFGLRAEHFEASRRIAGHALLPALAAAPQAAVIANGFSCREQIESLAGRRTLHLAEFLAAGLPQAR